MSESNYTTLRLRCERGVAFLTLDHGELNLMDMNLLTDLDAALNELEADAAVNVVVLQSANPDFFVAHADLDTIALLPPAPPPRAEKMGMIHALLDRLRTTPMVTIAKVAGRCRGGGSELALACDMRFAALGKAVFCQPEVGVGIIPGAGGTVRLPRLVGRGRALEIILGCADFSAEEAERYGYINRALPADELDVFVDSLAYRMAGFPAETIALAKESVSTGEAGLPDQLAREEELFLRSVHSDPAKRRMAAALAAGMQTPELEKSCFTHIWEPLAGL
ncbi:MAG: enoyl-CoA hydratase/isomerase family protein [Pseudomonadales bacterium]|nr:enoyl-CoA hydratase/isomerase family protein [Halioglobus sp.]MCP5128321.1 enoyl-CoA hydratase/isomerase family protein [Pseudomonadales bacterium]